MWRTLLIAYVLMASGGSTSVAAGGSAEAEMPQEDSQSDIFQSRYYSDNRYEVLAEGVGYPSKDKADDMDWQEQSRKRRRRETGSVDFDTFSKMSPDEKLNALFFKLSTMESKQNSLSSVMSPVYEKVDILEDCVNIHDRKLKMLSYRSLDLEARSRRNNLVFRGLCDVQNVQNENCTGMIVDFLSVEMNIQISQSDIVRAHRLGSLRQYKSRFQITKRPIIVAFKEYSLVERIMDNVRCLWGKGYRVEKDFPTEIAEARRNLWPKLKAEKAKNPYCKISIGYPAKLIKNNRVIADEFPDWRRIMRTSRVQGFESTESGEEEDCDSSSEVNRGQTRKKHVFRPWQPRDAPSRNPEQQQGPESDSDSSVIGPTQSQQTRKKLFTKQRMNEKSANELKMTEKMKLNKDNKFKNKLPFMKSRDSASKFPQSKTKADLQNENGKRSSSLPDMSRGRSISRSRPERGQREEPINGARPKHVTPGVNTMNEHSNDMSSQVKDTTQGNTQG